MVAPPGDPDSSLDAALTAGPAHRRRHWDWGDWGLAALLTAFLLWGGLFIAHTSFPVEGARTFCLFDDAMISMAYARNLCEGHGLNWARQGAPVEGFSHPLWLLPMIAVNATALPLRLRSLPIQLLSLALLALDVLVVRTLMLRHFSAGGSRHWLLAAALTAFYYPLDYWSLMGMETGLQALLTTLTVLLALDIVCGGRDRHLALWGVLSCAFLLRMDMLLVVLAVQAFVLTYGGVRREERRHWLLGLALFCGSAGAYEIFRWLYFHDLLPNTYYLKLTGVAASVRVMRGWTSLRRSGLEHAALLAAVALGCATVLRRDRRAQLPLLVVLACCAYSVFAGGDAWDDDLRAGRFIAFVVPLLFVLLNAAFNRILARWPPPAEATPGEDTALPRGRRPGAVRPARSARSARAARTALLGANLLLWLALAEGLVLSPRAAANRREAALCGPPYLVPTHQLDVLEMARLRRLAAPSATVATAAAGIPAFFGDFKMIDLLGYNDRDLARRPSQVPYTLDNYADFKPGHAKWDTLEVLETRRPDVLFAGWGIRPARLPRVMRRLGYVQDGQLWLLAAPPGKPAVP